MVDVHVNVALPPAATDGDEALKESVGGAMTVSFASAVAGGPTGPAQEIVKTGDPAVAKRIDSLPESAFGPDQPEPPAVQAVALALCQRTVAFDPGAMTLLSSDKLTDGGDNTLIDTVRSTDTLAPVQRRVNTLSACDSGPTSRLPLTACGPLQAPLATQEEAFVVLHRRVDLAPLAICAGVAVKLVIAGGATTRT